VLVRAWKTLHEWIYDAGKNKLILGAKLTAAANEFVQSGKREFLSNDNPNLAVVEKELANPRMWFNATEVAFVRKSVALSKRRFRIGVGITAAVVIVVAGLAVSAWVQGCRELEQTKVAEAQSREADTQRDRAMQGLRSSESIRMAGETPAMFKGEVACGAEGAPQEVLVARALTWPSAEVRAAMMSMLAATPCLIRVLSAASVALSPDESRMVVGGEDGTLRLWHTESGRPFGPPITGSAGMFESVVLRCDGSRIASGDMDGSVRLWPARTHGPGCCTRGLTVPPPLNCFTVPVGCMNMIQPPAGGAPGLAAGAL